ncbi:hypothetical protein VHEMI02670 [[Torrubiella] hemipterigena]|uniref:Nucleoporin Nup159/Nup146 N-terminal domain-containing protein n=1 Tax=[Torrubiella] hemipterigena TaxID=1531966 RepID=A0A0A1SQA0_9HYPO|nr:hypothetical protein VHEMI02670 [[Torrubiella] hemipterigena]
MAFSSFASAPNAMAAAGGNAGADASSSSGPELQTIQTEALGFLSIAGDAKVRLTSPWENAPSNSSSLLSIASRKGLIAAAGPDHISFSSTESVRKAFESPKDGDSDIRKYQPQLNIPMPMRISQVAFTADENYLILSAETGGGLAVYEVASLLQGSTNSAFELPTGGETLRSLIPNPTVERAELCAIVTSSGSLHMANLKDKQLSNPLKSQVSCLSWSAKGKQLCAGLADGTIVQMTPEGDTKAQIPIPPGFSNCHVSSLTWLENHLFLAIYTINGQTSSTYQIITRQPPSSFTFQKINDPVQPYGGDKAPHHTLLRLRDFPPDLQDLLIVASTASTEVGLLSRSTKALAADNQVTGAFTMTELLDDTKRPTLPMTDSYADSVPVGVALDLSATEKVYRPIPSEEELNESHTALPGLWILTHEGVLCSWWLVYTDSVKQAKAYPGLTVAGGASAPAPAAQAAPAATPANPFASSSASPFGATAPAAGGSAFGASSQLGQKASPWGASTTAPAATGGPTFGSSTFGSSTPASNTAFGKTSSLGFGQSSQLGLKSSPWGAAGATGGSAFGQSGFASFANKSGNQSAFGSPSVNAAPAEKPAAAPAPSGFASFASQGGFGSLGGNTSTGVFGSGSKPSVTPFGALTSSTNNTNSSNPFAVKSEDKLAGSVFGSTPFKLESSFKPDGSAKDDAPKPTGSGSSMFGSAFGSALTNSSSKADSTPAAKDEDMDVGEAREEPPQPKAPTSSLFSPKPAVESTTPTTTPAAPRFGEPATPAPGTSLFGQPTKLGGSFASGGLFGSSSTTPKQTSSIFGQPKTSEPKIKVEDEPEAPLPPDSTSKAAYPLGDSSASSAASSAPSQPFGALVTPAKPDPAPFPPFSMTPKPSKPAEDSPLPPDFTKSKPPEPALPPIAASKAASTTKPVNDAPLPPDFTTSIKKSIEAPLPPDPTKPSSAASSFVLPKAPSKESSNLPAFTDGSDDEEEEEEEEDEQEEEEEEEEQEEEDDDDDEAEFDEEDGSEGSGVDVAKDLSPQTHGFMHTPGYTPQSSFDGFASTTPATERPQESRTLFGEITRQAPLFGRPSAPSPRSPSPLRNAIPDRVIRSEASRSVSAPGMASQILGPKASQSQRGVGAIPRQPDAVDPFMLQHRKLREKQEAEEAQPLVDEEGDEIQRILASEIEGTLELDEFIAHSNVAPPAKESIPAQVEAVYRDINSMIDTLGLNARTITAFTKGHIESANEDGRGPEDLEIPDDWVLCEVEDLGDVLDNELYTDLEEGQVQDLEDKLDGCQDLAKDVQRLRAKQEDLRRVIMARMDPNQADVARSLPLSAEQSAQQNELRREFAAFSKLLSEAEEATTLLKARIASASSSTGRGSTNVPTVEAVMRTISKMTTMVEKRSGDVDVLETQLRKIRLASASRDGSPMATPQARRSIMMSPDSTPARNLRQSLSSSIAFGSTVRATPPRKKLSGFSKEEKGDLMEKRARRQAVLEKLKGSVEKRGVNVWNLEDIE